MGKARPDVFWIVTDEHRADGIGAYGNPWIETPNLDRLAANGVLFERAYCQTPACVASRASFLSGWYPHRTGNMWYDRTPDSVPFFTRYLQDAGYATVNIGKEDHHRSRSAFAHCLDHDDPMRGGSYFTLTPEFAHQEEELGVLHRYTTPHKPLIIAGTNPLGQDEAEAGTRVNTTLSFLERYDRADPLLLRVSLLFPHTPVLPPRPFDTAYSPERMGFPHDGKPSWGRPEFEQTALAYLGSVQGMRREDVLKMRAHYYGLCSYVDQQIGRLLDYLEANWSRPYVVVFHPDHGTLLGEHELHEKFSMYEPARQVPLIIAGAGIPTGERVSRFVELVDVAPTLLELAGVPTNDRMGLQGRDLMPLVRDERIPWRDAAFTEHRIFVPGQGSTESAINAYVTTEIEGERGHEITRLHEIVDREGLDWSDLEGTPYRWWGPTFKCLRTDGHVLSVRPLWREGEGDDWMGTLYDLVEDPLELNNVFDDPAYGQERDRLIEELRSFDLATG